MHGKTRLPTLVLLLGAVLPAAAVEIVVGDRRIDVPLPDDFVELTPQMSPYYESMKAYIAPTNTRFLSLIRSAEAESLLRGEDTVLVRYMNVESENGIIGASVSAAQFEQLRDIVRNQIDDMYAKVNESLPGLVEAGNSRLSDEFDADVAVSLGGLVPLPIHLDTRNAMANSMYMTVGSSVDGEQFDDDVLAATTLFLHVKDKVLFLYVYGEEADLDWTRETAAQWARDIVAANALSADEQRAVMQPGPGIDWETLAWRIMVGVLIGAVIGLVLVFRRRQP